MPQLNSRIPLGVFAALLFLVGWLGLAQAVEVPAYRGYVNDYAGMLSAEAAAQLERELAAFDRSDSTQVAVLTVPSLEGEALEDFSIKVAEKWGVGRKGKDNGVILLVAKQEHRIRLEVGRGLEGVLTDLVSGRIIDRVITPAFRAGQVDEGVLAGVAAIIQASRGEFKAEARDSRRGNEPSPLFKFMVLALIATVIIGRISRWGGMTAGAFLYPLATLLGLTPGWSLVLLLLLVPVGGLLGWLLWPLVAAFARNAANQDHYRGGGFGGGGFGGGGGGGFGGFGGGGFGGGGASGGW